MSASLRLVEQLPPWEQAVRVRVMAWQRERARRQTAEDERRQRLRRALIDAGIVLAALLGGVAVMFRLFR